MKRALRNRLGDLLLEAFDDPEKRQAIIWLALFCRLAAEREYPEVPLPELLEEGREAFPGAGGTSEGVLAHVIGPEKLLRLRRGDTGDVLAAGIPARRDDIPWVVEPEPDARAAFPALCERARMYGDLVVRMEGSDATSHRLDPLRKAMAEAALCFNAGLFFEAHEHLEHSWMAQPKGPTKRFLQGIIQISVGFHHARAGNHDGAVNQLTKGLEKTAGVVGVVLGLDCDSFLPRVAAFREAILERGRAGMFPVPLAAIPPMAILE